jgi:hypothetical protein
MVHDGHLYSQGLDYGPVAAQLETVMTGAPGWQNAARGLRAHYLFWGPREQARWPDSKQPWRQCALRVATSGTNELFLITPCLMGD